MIINDGRDLLHVVENWVDKNFNFVQLEVLEKMADGYLFEYVKPLQPDYDEFLNNCNLRDEYEESGEDIEDFCEDHMDFDDWKFEQEGENYPMWNTCFEFKFTPSKNELGIAEKYGFGIIEGLEPYKEILFVAGAGYSFYASHWIPMFLELPWNSDIKKQVIEKNINYNSL